MFWLITGLLFLVAAGFVLVPLFLQGGTAGAIGDESRREANIALYEERKTEYDLDLANGHIDQQQYAELILETKRALLSDVEQVEESGARESVSSARLYGRLVPVLSILIIPLFAYPLYFQWGYFDDVRLMDLYQRTVDNRDDPEEARALIFSLGEEVRKNNNQPWPLYFLAENLSNFGLMEQAGEYYQRAADNMDEIPEKAVVLGRLAMVRYVLAEFQMAPEVVSAIEQARAINPNDFGVLQLLASDAEGNADFAKAIEYWRLLIQINPNSQLAAELRSRIRAAQEVLAMESGETVTDPQIDVALSLADGVELNPNLSVFIAAHNAEGQGGPPLAVTRLTVGELPATVRLDNNLAPAAFNLSSANEIYVTALVSFSNTANPSSGDYRQVSGRISPGQEVARIDMQISDRVP